MGFSVELILTSGIPYYHRTKSYDRKNDGMIDITSIFGPCTDGLFSLLFDGLLLLGRTGVQVIAFAATLANI